MRAGVDPITLPESPPSSRSYRLSDGQSELG